MNIIKQMVILMLITIGVISSCLAEEAYNWSTSFEYGVAKYDFRGSSDTTNLYGVKLEIHANQSFSTFIGYHSTNNFTLANVANFEVDFVEIPEVIVKGDYHDLSLGFTGRYRYKQINLTATIGYARQNISASAHIPNVGVFEASDGDTSFFYGLGIEFNLSKSWFLNLDFKNSNLLKNSEIYTSTIGIEYRF